MRGRVERLVALVWGFAEATVFFIVPDVWVSFVALRGGWGWVRTALMAGVGALIGGSVMYLGGYLDEEAVGVILLHIPPISVAMLEEVVDQVSRMGLWGMFVGAFTGRPYKVYAAVAGAMGIHPVGFLVVSYPARVIRFLLVGGATAWLVRALGKRVPYSLRVLLHGVGWVVFYVWFFSVMGRA